VKSFASFQLFGPARSNFCASSVLAKTATTDASGIHHTAQRSTVHRHVSCEESVRGAERVAHRMRKCRRRCITHDCFDCARATEVGMLPFVPCVPSALRSLFCSNANVRPNCQVGSFSASSSARIKLRVRLKQKVSLLLPQSSILHWKRSLSASQCGSKGRPWLKEITPMLLGTRPRGLKSR
jgi:hypothetical protein